MPLITETVIQQDNGAYLCLTCQVRTPHLPSECHEFVGHNGVCPRCLARAIADSTDWQGSDAIEWGAV